MLLELSSLPLAEAAMEHRGQESAKVDVQFSGCVDVVLCV